MGVKVSINIRPDVLSRRLTPELKRYAHSRLRDYCDKYVPYRDGFLSQNVKVSDECVHYTQEYAAYQYTGDGFNFRRDKHPLATSHWDKAAMTVHGDDLAADIEDAIRGGRYV